MNTTKEDEFFSREELLKGSPSRLASILLFAVENQVAFYKSRAKQATALYLTKKTAEQHEHEFLDALAAGRHFRDPIHIQDIERFAPKWTSLVSQNKNVIAALAHQIASKYNLYKDFIPNIRESLRLADPEIHKTYQDLYGQPLDSIYTPKISIKERFRWFSTSFAYRLETLPPFWMALALTMPGATGLIALPIAFANLGLWMGILLLVIFGLVNMITVAALAESVARSGTSRFGLGFLGQLVSEYLGKTGSGLLTLILSLNNFIVLIIFYIGVAGTLEGATTISSKVWIILIFAVGVFFLSRRSLSSTVASTLMIVFVCLALIIIIPLLALPWFSIENFSNASTSLMESQSIDWSIFQAVFGVMLSTYFSHLLVATYGPIILERDSSGRSWIRGSAAAIFVFMLISCLWLVVINGALPNEILATTTGTVLTPLAEEVGPVVNILGSILVVLSLGLATVQVSLALYYLVQERLPSPGEPTKYFTRLSDIKRFILGTLPVAGVFLLAEYVAITGTGSFAQLLGYLGTLSLPLLGGVFPMLLLGATRRKGDFVPKNPFRPLGNPLLITLIYLLFISIIFLYGLFIWDNPIVKFVTFCFGGGVIGTTIVMLRRGMLDGRLVFELCQDYQPSLVSNFTLTALGKPYETEISFKSDAGEDRIFGSTGMLPFYKSLHSLSLNMPSNGIKEFKVWTHKINEKGIHEGIPIQIDLNFADNHLSYLVDQGIGVYALPASRENINLTIFFRGDDL